MCGGIVGYAKQGGFGNLKLRHVYSCRDNFCTARSMRDLDAYVTVTVLDYLRKASAAELLDDHDDPEMVQAAAQIEEWKAQIDDATVQFIANTITATTLGRIESELRAKIAGAERRVKHRNLPTIAAELAGADDIDAEWDDYTVEQRGREP